MFADAVEGADFGGIQVFLFEHGMELDDDLLEGLFPWSGEDLGRMAAFTHRGAKTSWCLSRYLSRHVLAAASGTGASRLRIGYGSFGKPVLEDSPVRFNWSHTPGCVLLALSCRGNIGCDIEDSTLLNPGFRDIARSFYSPAELDWLDGAPAGGSPQDRFLTLFVEKEARLKASGLGVGRHLAGTGGCMRDAPFRQDPILCFRWGADNRYVAAVCAASNTAGEIRMHSYRLESGRPLPARNPVLG